MAGALQARGGEQVTKIKNFKVNLRPREIARWLKKERGQETTPELEAAVASAIQESKGWLSPAAVYTTLTRKTAEKTTPIPFIPEAIALSIAAVSIGPRLESERQKAEAGSPREAMLAALAHEGLAQSLQFAVRLVGDQAEEEECQMTSPVCVQEAQDASALATLLGAARIGIPIDSNAPAPPYVRIFYWFWVASEKKVAV